VLTRQLARPLIALLMRRDRGHAFCLAGYALGKVAQCAQFHAAGRAGSRAVHEAGRGARSPPSLPSGSSGEPCSLFVPLLTLAGRFLGLAPVGWFFVLRRSASGLVPCRCPSARPRWDGVVLGARGCSGLGWDGVVLAGTASLGKATQCLDRWGAGPAQPPQRASASFLNSF